MSVAPSTDRTESTRAASLRVLIVGGYGTFGGRLADLLIDEARLTLLIAGRSLPAAAAFCAPRQSAGSATLVPTRFDRAADLSTQLAALSADLVVDASGPFQAYAGDAYALPRACIAAGCDYIDLADAAAFVTGIDAIDADAKRAGRFILSGASSFPVLTAAVVRHLARDLDQVDAISAGIAPSPFAGVGLNVIKAIASYTGKPVTVTDRGKRVSRPGFVDSRRMTVAVPGAVPLPSIRFGLTEVPDLEVLAVDWPAASTIWMGAGPTPAALHRLLWAAGLLVQYRMLPSLTPLAPLMHRVINTLRWGEHRGGMIVTVVGVADGSRSWHLLADGDSGPFIPSMAAEALIRQRLAGRVIAPGARSAHRDLDLEDYNALFERRGIVTGFRSSATITPGRPDTPYLRVLGAAYAHLPAPIQDLHKFEGAVRYAGRARVMGAGSLRGRLIARAFGFPPAQDDCAVTVDLNRIDGVETWRRGFAGYTFQSTQETGKGCFEHLIIERFGPFAFGLAAVVEQERLHLIVRRWTAFGVPMPRAWAPKVAAHEHAAQGRFNFSVDLGLPLVGRLVKYEGWLTEQRDRQNALAAGAEVTHDHSTPHRTT